MTDMPRLHLKASDIIDLARGARDIFTPGMTLPPSWLNNPDEFTNPVQIVVNPHDCGPVPATHRKNRKLIENTHKLFGGQAVGIGFFVEQLPAIWLTEGNMFVWSYSGRALTIGGEQPDEIPQKTGKIRCDAYYFSNDAFWKYCLNHGLPKDRRSRNIRNETRLANRTNIPLFHT